MAIVHMVIFDSVHLLKTALSSQEKEQWKCVLTISGVQFVILLLVSGMLELHVHNSITMTEVSDVLHY